jgi:hypothetical protein
VKDGITTTATKLVESSREGKEGTLLKIEHKEMRWLLDVKGRQKLRS